MSDVTDWDDRRSERTASGPAWVSAADAADKAGITPSRVREWASEGLIASQSTQGPLGEQVLVRLEEVVDLAHGEPPQRREPEPARVYNHVSTAELSPIFKTIPELVAQLTSATDRAARAETKVDFLTRQVAELKRQLAETSPGTAAAEAAAAEPSGVDEVAPLDDGDAPPGDTVVPPGETLAEPPDTVAEPADTFAPHDPGAAGPDSLASVFDDAPGLPGDPELPLDEARGPEPDDSLSSIWEDDAPAPPGAGLSSDRETRRVRRLPDPPRRRRWWSRRR